MESTVEVSVSIINCSNADKGSNKTAPDSRGSLNCEKREGRGGPTTRIDECLLTSS